MHAQCYVTDELLHAPRAPRLNATVQPALDAVAQYHRMAWSPARHAHLPAEISSLAPLLMRVGFVLSQRYGYSLQDPWRARVMPMALASVMVRRPLSQVEQLVVNVIDPQEEEEVIDPHEEEEEEEGEEAGEGVDEGGGEEGEGEGGGGEAEGG